MTTPLDAWRDAFERHDRCPWPGPRPLQERDAELLVGRADERRAFQRIMRENRLVLLHGQSGVGKSSLLRAGLIPDLERAGRTVYAADQWGGAQTSDLRVFLAHRLGLPDEEGDAFAAVDRESVVLVLDQFEELIRYSPTRALAVFDLIVDLNRTAETRIVISFRSEYLHEFAGLEARVVNFTTAQFRLEEVQPDAAENIVLAGSRRKPDAVDAGAAKEIAAAWRSARTDALSATTDSDPFSRVGLLHLQAFLYSLYFSGGGQTITEAAVRDAFDTWASSEDGPTVGERRAFHEALQRAVNHKLAHCRRAAADIEGRGDDRIDSILVDGTHWAVVRTVRHLSSAGYKLIRQAQELGSLALGDDLEALLDGLAVTHGPPSARRLMALFDAMLDAAGLGGGRSARGDESMFDVLSAERRTVAAAADGAVADEFSDTPWTGRLESSPARISADPVGVTAGPMMRLAPADVLVEEYRRIAFGLVWLEESALIRVTTLPGAGAMVSLIHDGFGSALVRWAERHEADPAGPLSAITAPRGASFGWRPTPAKSGEQPRRPDVGGEERHRVLANLVWRGARIRADLERVVFVNCDFRGLLFDGCRLTGANFVNCLLDGAIFSDCVISGAMDIVEDDVWSEDEPTFVVEAPPDLVAAHASYRGMPRTGDAFLSPLPGAPAVPFRGEPGMERLHRPGGDAAQRGRLGAPLGSGGVTIHGGRVSSLVVRGCDVDDDSALYLRHTVGSGLEIVEIGSHAARIRVYGGALRHVSLSPVVGASGVVDILVDGSVLSQVWVAPRLRGNIEVRNSSIIHAWNGSWSGDVAESVRFEVGDGSRYHGLIDVIVGVGATAMGPGEQRIAFEDIANPVLRDQHHRMDYRRNPAVVASPTPSAT